MKLALCQSNGTPGDVAANLAHIGDTAAAAAGDGADLVMFPELFLSGYNIGSDIGRLAESADGPAARTISEIARDAGIAILCGYPERADGKVYNAALLVGPDGAALANHRKNHLAGPFENREFVVGTGFAMAELAGFKLGILICYDLEFPEAARSLALRGVELILAPTALAEPWHVVARAVVPSRAFENQIFVAYANRVGPEGDETFVGLSCIIGPDGSELARGGAEEALLFATLDRAAIAEARKELSYYEDRRPEVYEGLG